MKKWLCACLAMLIAFSMVSVCSASETMLMPSMVTDSKGVTVGSDKITGMGHGKYVAFPNVNMDGVNSASVLFDYEMSGNDTGEVIGVFLDSPTSAGCLGYLILNQKGMGQTQKTALKKASGTHTVYFVYLLGRSQKTLSVYRFALSSETVTKDPTAGQVPDSFIEDNWSDTWVATDDCGRKVADYEEVGAVKTDGREVLMFYWDWRIAGNTPAQIIPELVAAHPEIMEPGNYFSPYWYEGSTYFWNEPALGFYSSSDYWVYRNTRRCSIISA